MTIIRQRAGLIPAADTNLPLWSELFPAFIDPLKLLIGDDLVGAHVTLNGYVPAWNGTGGLGGSAAWVTAAHTRETDGAARTAVTGTQTAVINSGIAGMRAMVTISHPTTTGDNPALIFRYADASNYWILSCDVQNGVMRLIKKVAGSNTTVSTAGVVVDGGVYEVRCVGNVITTYIDGTLIHNVTDAAVNTGTSAGFLELANGSPARFTNFMVGTV